MKRYFKNVLSTYIVVLVASLSIVLFLTEPLGFVIGAIIIFVCELLYPVGTKKIQVKYFNETINRVEKLRYGDWIDLRSAETVTLKAGEYRLVKLGVGMILPDGYEAHVLPRSSTPGKFGICLANGMGVIDNSYSGDGDEWHFPAIAFRDTVINKGDRIAQFRIVKNQPNIEFKVVRKLKKYSRGGLGSTGWR